MATQIQTVNRVLRRLREDQVTSVIDSDYVELIAEFVNAGIDETRDAHDWERFKKRSYVQYLLAGGVNFVELTAIVANGGDVISGSVFNENSKLLWWDQDNPLVSFVKTAFANIDGTEDWTHVAVDSPESIEQVYIVNGGPNGDSNSTSQEPVTIGIGPSLGDEYDGKLYLSMFPRPEQDGTFALQHWSPQGDLALDGSDNMTEIRYPTRPVFEYALWMALNERGEEIGEPGNMAEQRWLNSLASAIETDIDLMQRSNRYDWRRD